MIAVLLPVAMQAVAPVAVTNGDWTVACDQQRHCTAWARVPADATAGDAWPLVMLRRGGEAAAETVIDLPIGADIAGGTKLTIAVDGRVLAQLMAPGAGAGLSLPFRGALATALTRGRMLTLTGPRGRVRARTSLAGLGATLETIDAVQQRVGTRGALVKRGRVAAPPPLPPAPVVVTPPTDARAPRDLTRKQLAGLIGKPPRGCGPALSRGYRLDGTHTLLMIEPPCGAAGSATMAYVLPDKGTAQPAGFDVAAAAVPDAPAHRIAGGWDAARRRIAVLLPATAGRDCGTRRDFAWDGARFRLVEERLIAECHRATYEITTWRAIVRIG